MNLEQFNKARILVDELAELRETYYRLNRVSFTVTLGGYPVSEVLRDAAKEGLRQSLKKQFQKIKDDLWVYHSIRLGIEDDLYHYRPIIPDMSAAAPVDFTQPQIDGPEVEPDQTIGEALELAHQAKTGYGGPPLTTPDEPEMF